MSTTASNGASAPSKRPPGAAVAAELDAPSTVGIRFIDSCRRLTVVHQHHAAIVAVGAFPSAHVATGLEQGLSAGVQRGCRARSEIFDGGAGDDILKGAKGNDIFCAGDGNDVVHGGNGFDVVFGQAGLDILTGAEGNDVVVGDSSPRGLASKQTVKGGRGSDILFGGLDGDDKILGQKGHDTLIGIGSSGRIRFDGCPGFDVCAANGSTNIVVHNCESFFP